MSCKAMLVAVYDKITTRNRLEGWTQRNLDQMITDAQNGLKPVITTMDCEECKKDLEKDHVAKVEVEYLLSDTPPRSKPNKSTIDVHEAEFDPFGNDAGPGFSNDSRIIKDSDTGPGITDNGTGPKDKFDI